MINDPFVIFLLIVACLVLALETYLGFLRFQEWFRHKMVLLTLGLTLYFKAKDKNIKAIGKTSLKLFFWESNNDKDE